MTSHACPRIPGGAQRERSKLRMRQSLVALPCAAPGTCEIRPGGMLRFVQLQA